MVGLSAEVQLASFIKLAWNLNVKSCFCFALSAFFSQSGFLEEPDCMVTRPPPKETAHEFINSPVIPVGYSAQR